MFAFYSRNCCPDVETKRTTDGARDKAFARWQRPRMAEKQWRPLQLLPPPGEGPGSRGGQRDWHLRRFRGGPALSNVDSTYEPKTHRIFMQAGAKRSQSIVRRCGGWPTRLWNGALTFAGDEVQQVWGDGGHNGKQSDDVFRAMRWLWKDWSQPVKGGPPTNKTLADPCLLVKVGSC